MTHDPWSTLFARADLHTRGHATVLCGDAAQEARLSAAWAQAPEKPRWLHLLRVDEGAPMGVRRSTDAAARIARTESGGERVSALAALDAEVDAAIEDTVLPAHLLPRLQRRPSLSRPMGFATRMPGLAVVVGAGIAGAATAHALCLRGWRVRVLDPSGCLGSRAQAASATPAALMTAPDGDTLDSRALRNGIALTRAQLQRLPAVLGHVDATSKLAWVQPASLVAALAADAGFTIEAAPSTATIQVAVAQGDLSVLCAGAASVQLAKVLGWPTDRLHHTHPVPGQVLMGHTPYAASWATRVAEGKGHFMGDIGGGQWLVGASYSRRLDGTPIIDATPEQIAAEREDNIKRLRHFLGAAASDALRGPLSDWRGIRVSTRDRRPIIGKLGSPERWVFTGLGSHGLSWAFLGAELLAAWLHGEPLPVEARTARALSAERFAGQ